MTYFKKGIEYLVSWRKYHSEKNVNKTMSQPPSSDGFNKTGIKCLGELLLGEDKLILAKELIVASDFAFLGKMMVKIKV